MLAHLETLTTMEALMVALSGVAMVFLVLGCLAVLIMVNSKIADHFASKSKPAPAPKAAPVAVPVAPAAAPVEQEELVAVIMAAIAEETQCNPADFRITSIQEG